MPTQNSFIEYKAIQNRLENEYREASRAFKAIPDISDGIMGLTSDSVKSSPEWQTANTNFATAFANLRNFNNWFINVFSKELRQERKSRFAA